MTLTDALTGVVNRRGLIKFSKIQMESLDSRGYSITPFIGRVDCFKSYNDNYGHIAGDGASSVAGGNC